MAKKDDKKQKKPIKTSINKVEKKEKTEKKAITNHKPIKETKINHSNKPKMADQKSDAVKTKKPDKKIVFEKVSNKIETTTKAEFQKITRRTRRRRVSEAKFEDKKDLDKLYVFITIVNSGVSENIIRIFEEMGCSVSFVTNGVGTASEEIRKVLHIQDSKKEVVVSIIRESRLDDVEKELAAFFLATKKNKGVAFATKMDAIQGVRLYKFLSQTL